MPRDLTLRVPKGQFDIEKTVKARITEAALAELRTQPGFDPAALSISFGLRW